LLAARLLFWFVRALEEMLHSCIRFVRGANNDFGRISRSVSTPAQLPLIVEQASRLRLILRQVSCDWRTGERHSVSRQCSENADVATKAKGVSVLDSKMSSLGRNKFNLAVEHGENAGWLAPVPLEAIAV
jgi:hypothetical protein